MSIIFQKIELVNSMSQAPNHDSLFSRSKFDSKQKMTKWKIAKGIQSAAFIV